MSDHGAVVWFTGLPRAGKSTFARAVRDRLRELGVRAVILDGDEVRGALVPTPGYDEAARAAFYESLGRLAALAARQGFIVIVAATAHRRAFRDAARARAPRFVEVYVDTPPEICRARPGGELYRDATSAGALPGAGLVYEPPEIPEVHAAGGDERLAVEAVIRALNPIVGALH